MIYQQNNSASITFYLYGISTGLAITGKSLSDLSVKLAKEGAAAITTLTLVPSGATGSQRNAREIGDGIYEFDALVGDFDTLGRLRIIVSDTIGDATDDIAEHLVTAGNLDNLDAAVSDVVSLTTRILGLTQENYYLDNTSYDAEKRLTAGRVRIYNDAINVGTGSGIIATYNITATYDVTGLLTYSVTKS